jgi:hypothetical protein
MESNTPTGKFPAVVEVVNVSQNDLTIAHKII